MIVCDCPRSRHVHGTRRMYLTHACRCFPCRRATYEALRAYASGEKWREGMMVPAVGVRRRIEGLHAIGWSARRLAGYLEVSKQAVRRLTDPRTAPAQVMPVTYDAVAELYDRLWDVRPTGPGVNKTLTWAKQNGWAPPLAWDDETIDDPAAVPADLTPVRHAFRGRPSRYTADEDEHFRSFGWSDQRIAHRLGLSLDGLLLARKRAS